MARVHFQKFTGIIGGVFMLSLLGACSTAPERTDNAVENARSVYSEAATSLSVKQYAPVQLNESYQYLMRAERAETADARRHFAYLARQQAELAMAVADRRVAEEEMNRLSEERDSVVVRSARQRALTAEEEAEVARRELGIQERQTQIREAEIQRMQRELAEFKAKETDRGLVLTLDSFLFETDRADLKPGAYRSLDKLAAYLKQNPERRISIEGHTDNTGTSDHNLDLSRRRAEAVAQALQRQGIGRERIERTGYGEAYPVASNDTPAGRLQNRRVEVVIPGGDEIRAGGSQQ